MGVLTRPAAVVRIALMPIICAAAVFALDEYFWTLSFETGEGYGGLANISTLLDIVMVGFVAVAWHRFVLLDEAPRIGVPTIGIGRALRYAVDWVILGAAIGLLIALVVALIGYGMQFVAPLDPVAGQLGAGLFDIDAIFSPWTTWIVGTVFVYLLFRMGLGLPDMALGRNKLNMVRSLERTRALRGPILVLSLLAGAAQTPMLSYYSYLGDWFYVASPHEAALHGFISGVLWGVVALFGASVLTVIYRETEPSDVVPDEPSGGGPFEHQEDEGLL